MKNNIFEKSSMNLLKPVNNEDLKKEDTVEINPHPPEKIVSCSILELKENFDIELLKKITNEGWYDYLM